MSTIIMAQCWPLQMSPTQKSVLISLSDNASDEGVCWPSVGKISMRTCLSERAVQTAIRWLISAGILQVSERHGRSTVYCVCPDKFQPPQEPHPSDGGKSTPQELRPAGAAPAPEADAPPPPHELHPTPAGAAPRTIKEPPVEPPMNRKEVPLQDLVVEVFDHWRVRMTSPRAKLDDNRKKLIAKALKTYVVDDLKRAIDGCAVSPFHMGVNDRKTKYNGLDLILRNAEKIDSFIEKAENPPVADSAKPGSIHHNFHGQTYESTPQDKLADFFNDDE